MKREDIRPLLEKTRGNQVARGHGLIDETDDLIRVIESLLEENGECEWVQEDPFGDFCDTWQTDCGHEFVYIDGTPSDNDANFCCYCGKKLVERVVEEESP